MNRSMTHLSSDNSQVPSMVAWVIFSVQKVKNVWYQVVEDSQCTCKGWGSLQGTKTEAVPLQ